MGEPADSAGILGGLFRLRARYPGQYWLLVAGGLLNSVGGSMVWPFLTIYVRQRLGVPLTEVALLLTVNSAAGLVSTTVAGPMVDRLGRKWVMVASMAIAGATMLAMMLADTFTAWVAIFVVNGTFAPLLRVAGDAMIADLVPEERRANGYALLRVAQNVGVAIGPSVGGFLAVVSYLIAFGAAATANMIVALTLAVLAVETLPARSTSGLSSGTTPPETGYSPVLRDGPFLAFVTVFTLASMVGSMMMVLLPVYAKEGFGVPESQYGLIMATNAGMVVLFQYATTRLSTKYPPLAVLAAGALFYGVGAGSVALGSSFPAFLASMIVLTVGEMLLIPTATTLTARLAPSDMRGRYMGVYGLTWSVAIGLGPVAGGLLNDHVAPAAIWWGTLALGLAAAAGFTGLSRWTSVAQRITPQARGRDS